MTKKCVKHQIFRKLAADSSAAASADEVGRINIGTFYHLFKIKFDPYIEMITKAQIMPKDELRKVKN